MSEKIKVEQAWNVSVSYGVSTYSTTVWAHVDLNFADVIWLAIAGLPIGEPIVHVSAGTDGFKRSIVVLDEENLVQKDAR